MSDNKKLYKQMKTMNVILCVLVVICLVQIVLLLMIGAKQMEQADLLSNIQMETKAESETSAMTQAAESTSAAGEPVATEEAAVPAENEDMFRIETGYVDLGYPAQWVPYLQYEYKEENGVLTVAFCCSIGDNQTPLFDVHFGDAQMGECFGYIAKDGEKIPFTVTFHDYIPDESWDEDDKHVLYAMQESVNELIQAVKADPNYTAE